VRNHPTGLVDPDGRAGESPSGTWADSKAWILSAKESIKGAGDKVTNSMMDRYIAASDKMGLSGTARDLTLTGAAIFSTQIGTAVHFAGEVLMTGPNLMLAVEHGIKAVSAGAKDIKQGKLASGALKIGDATGVVTSAKDIRSGIDDARRGDYAPAAEKIGGGVANIAGQFLLLEAGIGKIKTKISARSQTPAVKTSTASELLREGKPATQLEKTYEHSLSPQAYIEDVASKYGINLKGKGLGIQLMYDENLGPGKLGVTRASEGGRIIRIGPDALVDQPTTANTIAHELSHARDYLRNYHKPHGSGLSLADKTPYGSGNALEAWIRGER
jgi:hypothetical protein